MSTPKAPQRRARGRRKFKGSKFGPEESAFDRYRAPRPFARDCNAFHRGDPALLKFFLPVIKGTDLFRGLPLNFAQIVDVILGEKQMLSSDPALMKEVDYYESCDNFAGRHPFWNDMELQPELLRKALSLCPAHVLQHYTVVQRALARLYAVTWWGRGPDSAEAKRQLEQLIPKGNVHPATKYIPEIAQKFRVLRRCIRDSNELMKTEFPREDERVEKLAELYAESTGVVSAALCKAERPFLAEQLHEVLGIAVETARKALQKHPAT